MSSKSQLSSALSAFQKKQVASNKAYLQAHPSARRSTGSRATLVLKSTVPPASNADRDVFTARLAIALNEQLSKIESKEYVFEPITLPKDYRNLLELVDGVQDVDLRGQGVAGVDGVHKRVEEEQVKGSVVPGLVSDLPCAGEMERARWECRAGFVLGRGDNMDEDWCCYCYCREGETDAWRWLVWYREAGMDWAMTFQGLVAWMRWYGDWWDRVNGAERNAVDDMTESMETMQGDDDEEDDSEENEAVMSDSDEEEEEDDEGYDDMSADDDDDDDEEMEGLEAVYKMEH